MRPSAPVVALLHGGFWRGPYNHWLMSWVGRDLSSRGYTVFNVEYRRMGLLGGGGGWPQTFDDAVAAVDEISVWTRSTHGDHVPPIVLVGHSAGGHLALVAAARRPSAVVGVVSIAGPTDLRRLARDGSDVVLDLISDGARTDPPEHRYASTSPVEMLPIGVPLVCVHGSGDSTVDPRQSADFVEAAALAGDDARLDLVEGDGHRAALRPASSTWRAVATAIERLVQHRPVP